MERCQIEPIKFMSNCFDLTNLNKIWKKLNFEFMDSNYIPINLRFVLRDILEVGSRAPFRKYEEWVVKSVYEYACKHHIAEVVELGAGSAPISKGLAKKYPNWDVNLKITDLSPDVSLFEDLANSDKRIICVGDSVNFTKHITGCHQSLLVLSATFHHVPEKIRKETIENLKRISPHVLIFEPVCQNIYSLLMNLGILITGLLTPIFKIKSKSFFRSLFWCWIIPIAPILLLWDGTISVLRCWSKKEWLKNVPNIELEGSLSCLKVSIKNE